MIFKSSNCLLNTPTQPLSHTIRISAQANITIVPGGPTESTFTCIVTRYCGDTVQDSKKDLIIQLGH